MPRVHNSISFKAWFIVEADNDVRMIDTDPAELLNEGEEYFGPYTVQVPMPRRIEQCLKERETPLQGAISHEPLR